MLFRSAGVTALAAGVGHGCALLPGGTARCWGDNGSGQLGDPSLAAAISITPVYVSGLAGATALALGRAHGCALLEAGTVKCWGANEAGQLGDGSLAPRTGPVDVAGLSGVTALAAGQNHTCALLAGGGVKCWGANENGQLGTPRTGDQPSPVDVSSLAGATAISAGKSHSCALLAGVGVRCWGHNWWGELGNGEWEVAESRVPVAVVF